MKTSLKLALAAGLTIAGIGFAASSASALPMSGLDPAIATSADVAQGVDKVWWRHYGWHRHYWGYRPYWGGYYGWHRPWGWHRWGWRPYW